jgi:hypothetical protein
MSAASGLDWQFVIVTLAALGGALVLLRPLLPSRKGRPAEGTCPGCAAGDSCAAKGVSRAAGSGLVTLGGGPRRGPAAGK